MNQEMFLLVGKVSRENNTQLTLNAFSEGKVSSVRDEKRGKGGRRWDSTGRCYRKLSPSTHKTQGIRMLKNKKQWHAESVSDLNNRYMRAAWRVHPRPRIHSFNCFQYCIFNYTSIHWGYSMRSSPLGVIIDTVQAPWWFCGECLLLVGEKKTFIRTDPSENDVKKENMQNTTVKRCKWLLPHPTSQRGIMAFPVLILLTSKISKPLLFNSQNFIIEEHHSGRAKGFFL